MVDDHHFALAGLDPETLGGYFLTEEQGAALAVFPISERLRYLVPFAEPAETVEHLAARRGAGSITLVDDGEKFGVWPGTNRLVYAEGWLRRFLDALREAKWLAVSTFSRVLDTQPPRGRVYLPTASYTEMGEWALPAPAAAEIEEARERLRALPDGAAPRPPPARRTVAGLPREVSGGGRRLLAHAPPLAPHRGGAGRAPGRSRPRSRRGSGSGAARPTTPTGTASSAAATCRISAAPCARP